MLLRELLCAASMGARVLGLVMAACLLVCWGVGVLGVDIDAVSPLPECPARATGGSCVLCGMTHSFVWMARGDLNAARGANPGGPLLFTFFCAAAGICLVSVARDRLARVGPQRMQDVRERRCEDGPD